MEDGGGNGRRSARREGARPTVRDIAARSGVSRATVSRVLNGRPDVAAATREAVLRHIRDDAYSTNRMAKGLSSGRTGLIGVTVPYINAEYFMEILTGVAQALYVHDARLVVCPTEHEHDLEVSLLDRVMHGTTDGAILILPSESNQELQALRSRRFPFVIIDPSQAPSDDIVAVSSNHWSGARTMTEHLLSLGHRRIAAIRGLSWMTASNDRLAGFHSALISAGLPPNPELIAEGDWNVGGGRTAMEELLRLEELPTAVFAFNDNMAVGALDAIAEHGLRVPEDISVAGFDDTNVAGATRPKLTTVHQPLHEMGRIAVSLLYRTLQQQPLDATHVELSTRLIVRQSTGPPRR